jgi:tripartite ATP-independent transporter DctM subunit|tara:strand:- start:3708 stop:5015 length:1308 start_codon:yes stop_codon:yes gene_type:complete
MSNGEIGLLGLAVLLSLIALRIPIGIALLGVSFSGIWATIGLNPALGMLRVVPYSFATNWELSSVPMFLFMGFLCYHAGLTRGLFEAAQVWLARLPGGLAIASVFGAAGFAAVTGSSLACAAAMGRMAVPEMMRARYSMALATGTVAAAGTIGALIPPSILFIIYGVIAQEPISQLFLGGAAVGVLTAIAYILTILIWTVVQPDAAPIVIRIYTLREKFNALWGVIPIFLLAGSVFGGLFGGIFTPTEAGAVGSGIAVLIAFFKRTLTWNTFRDSITEAFVTSSALFLIAVGANLLSRFVALSGAGDLLSDIVLGVTNDPFMLMILIVIVYLVLGMFLDPIGAMLITLPVLLPIAEQAQFNLIWFGVIVAKLLEIGMITPPVGLNVFIIKSVVPNSITLTTIFKGVLVFLVADLVVVLLIMLFPEIVLFLPNLMQ